LHQNYVDFKELGVEVVVIVGQKRETVKKWLTNNPFEFLFLVDETRTVIKQFEVFNPINVDAFRIAHPSLFLIFDHRVLFNYVGSNQRDRPTIESTKELIKKLV
jgi:peroxiredoxin